MKSSCVYGCVLVLCVVLGTGLCEELCHKAKPCRCVEKNFSVDFEEAVKHFP